MYCGCGIDAVSVASVSGQDTIAMGDKRFREDLEAKGVGVLVLWVSERSRRWGRGCNVVVMLDYPRVSVIGVSRSIISLRMRVYRFVDVGVISFQAHVPDAMSIPRCVQLLLCSALLCSTPSRQSFHLFVLTQQTQNATPSDPYPTLQHLEPKTRSVRVSYTAGKRKSDDRASRMDFFPAETGDVNVTTPQSRKSSFQRANGRNPSIKPQRPGKKIRNG